MTGFYIRATLAFNGLMAKVHTQLALTCLKSTVETIKKKVNSVQV